MDWVVLLVVVIILGALAGGNTFGETIRAGCGCLVLIIFVLFLLALMTGVLDQG